MEHTIQHGQGIGDFLAPFLRFFRPLAPFISAGGKALGQQVASSLGGMVGDIASGKTIRESGRERTTAARQELERRFREKMERLASAGQFGSGGNKTHHNAVKLFSFSPSTGSSGCAPKKRRVIR